MRKRNYQIDALRAILILIIVFFHYTYRFSGLFHINTLNFFSLAEWGSIGVAGFFIISGYFLKPSNIKRFSMREYLKNRLLRLYPAYILAIIIIYLSVTIFGLSGRSVSFLDFILNIPLLNGFIGAPYVDGAHWYITYLAIFSIIFAIVSKTKIKPLYYLPTWLLLKNFLLLLSMNFSFLSPAYKFIGGDYVEYIVIGLSLAEILRFNAKDIKQKIFYILIISMSIIQSFFLTSPIIAIGTIIVLGVFILTIKEKLAILEKIKFFTILGESSYCIYLFHQNIGYQIILALLSLTHDQHIVPIIFTTMLIMISASIAIHYLYEAPIIRRLK